MPNDLIIFFTVTVYIFVAIMAFVVSVVVPQEDAAREAALPPIQPMEFVGCTDV